MMLLQHLIKNELSNHFLILDCLSIVYSSPIVSNMDKPIGNRLHLRMKSNFMKVRETVQSYDIESLIGEIGGTLSMFMGFCGLNIIQFMASFRIDIYGQKLNLKPMAVLAMFLPFVYWSTQSVQRYMDEPMSSQPINVKSNIKSEFPQLTFCIDKPKLQDALALATLDQSEYSNFHAALEAALKTDINLDLQNVNNSAFYGNPIEAVYVELQGMCSSITFTF